MNIRRLYFLALPLILAMLLIGMVITSASAADTNSAIQGESEEVVANLSVTSQKLSFRLNTDQISVDSFGRIKANGLQDSLNKPGLPELPFFTSFILLPPEATVDVVVDEVGSRYLKSQELELFQAEPETVIVQDLESSSGSVIKRTIDFEIVEEPPSGIYPGSLYKVSEPMYLRDLRIIKIDLFPVRYDADNRQLINSLQLNVEINFKGAVFDNLVAGPSVGDRHVEMISDLLINPEQVSAWRSLPANFGDMESGLPIGRDVYKIEIIKNGIYELDYTDLISAGMDVDNINPATLEMMYRGKPVAYEYIGNSADGNFDPEDSLRFYGWAFDGPRLEKQYVNENVFWLWANGTSTKINSSQSVLGTPVSSFMESVTREPENIWFASWTDQWDSFPNDPDAWYWDKLYKKGADPLTFTYQISLPDPVNIGQDGRLIAEFSSKWNPVVDGGDIPHKVKAYLNDHPPGGEASWYGKQNINVDAALPVDYVLDGANIVTVVLATESNTSASYEAIYLNRITIDYERQLKVVSDQLIFSDVGGGSRQFQVRGFLNGVQEKFLIWDISERTNPVSISSSNLSAKGADNTYTVTFGTDRSSQSYYIISTGDNVLKPVDISRYLPKDLAPNGNGAEWIAITHKDFITEANRLAEHRSKEDFGGFQTAVIDVEAVINQYGYGLPIPKAITGFLSYALKNWGIKPSYVALFGDATYDPHNNLGKSDRQFVLTNLDFVDRYQGQIPSDLKFSAITPGDLFPDLAVGRIPVQTQGEASAVVNKIKNYEESRLLPAEWMLNVAYLADDTDIAGDFCLENELTANHFPSQFKNRQFCYGTAPYTQTTPSEVRNDFIDYINNVGATFVNYRGHGSIDYWGGGVETIMNTDDLLCERSCWNNPRPVVVVTGDCLDSFFTRPGTESLSEVMIQSEGKGSAAHFSSTGLGFSYEHSLMVGAFYDGLFINGNTAIGDAVNFARAEYIRRGLSQGWHESILYSFLLTGDPAMQLLRPELKLTKSADRSDTVQGEEVNYTLKVENLGIYPSIATIRDTLPDGLNYISSASSVATEVTVSGQSISFELQFGDLPRDAGIPWKGSATVNIKTIVAENAKPGWIYNDAFVRGTGIDAFTNNNKDSVGIFVEEYVAPSSCCKINFPVISNEW